MHFKYRNDVNYDHFYYLYVVSKVIYMHIYIDITIYIYIDITIYIYIDITIY